MPGMYVARLVCSDAACAEEVAGEAMTLAELETLICECGCGLAVMGWPDAAAESRADVVLLRAASHRHGALSDAA